MFNLENPFWNTLGKLCDYVILNILFILCSIPIFTIGVSTTAMYSVLWKISKDEGGTIATEFFKAWKKDFKKATILWMILLPIGLLTIFEMYMLYQMEIPGLNVLKYVFVTIFITWLMLVSYAFPTQAFFGSSIKETLKNSLLMCLFRLFPWTIMIVTFNLLPWLLITGMFGSSLLVIEIVLILGFVVCAWVNSCIFVKKIFK